MGSPTESIDLVFKTSIDELSRELCESPSGSCYTGGKCKFYADPQSLEIA
jgi:hypothetical protein